MTSETFDRWRGTVHESQREALPEGATVVSSTAPYGSGGLGRHLEELVEALRIGGRLAAYLSPAPKPEDVGAVGITVHGSSTAGIITTVPPVRLSPGWRILLANMAFDRAAPSALPRSAKRLLVFNGHALRHVGIARQWGYDSVGLVSANSHLAYVARQHDKAWRQYPIERPWGKQLVARNVREYGCVDLVYVSSRHAWETFVNEGFAEERLRMFPLTPHERYQMRQNSSTVATFNVVYIGSLAVHKGVALLLDAFRRVPYDDMRLILVGGWGTRGMRRHVERACAEDRRIMVRPGDPLPVLLQASVCVHPSYDEGFGYAPAEALACGVPVIVSEDTGMKELVRCGVDGLVIPTGDLAQLTAAIDAAYNTAV